ncbi:MAG: nucleotide exchange factor GrpE [Bacilli bacterium]|nr:nucleotide exchange factor GrpE [Bacilli bacterium]
MEENIEVIEKEEVKENKKEKKNKYQEQIKVLEDKVKELEDKNIRVTAEMVNSLRRKEEENNRLMKYASESLILDILSTIDNFERALSVKSDNADIENYQKGFDMIYQNLVNTLNKYEVKEIECLGLEFDPTYHQAVMTDHIDGKKENEIIEVLQKGYTYKDKVIRPAMVKVNN